MKRKILNHFQKTDEVMYKAAKKTRFLEEIIAVPQKSYFQVLCHEIISQQLAGSAAQAISKRFSSLFPRKQVTPYRVLEIPEEQIREAGLSWAKVYSVKDLAAKTQSKEVYLNNLADLKDKEVIAELTKVKGIGPWTAEMFLMFSLAREDIFSPRDLGLKKGMELVYGLNNPSIEEMEDIAQKWFPYRSWGSRVLWSTLDN